jgi:adenylate cyclase
LERRLAAILFADVVAYTRLMGEDEAGTLARLQDFETATIKPAVARHRGRIVKRMGDGFLLEFSSVVSALQCALDWQGAGGGPASLRFRIGIHLGDVIADGDDIYGEGVNLAARLEPLAEPGGICASEDAYRQVRGKLDLAWDDLGPQDLKNISAPVGVYRLPPARTAIDPPSPARPPTRGDKPVVAVLPFANMSGDREQEYFSDGITEDLITELSRFRELSVVSRSSSFVFKGKSAATSEICAKLEAQYLVEGSIRKAGQRLRITAQLIEADRDRHIWAERYDRDLEDIFAVQDDIVRRVASTLVGRLEHRRQERNRRRSESELRAYDLYLRGREHFFTWSREDNLKARDLVRAAISIEPDYAAAQALLSEILLRMWLNGWSEKVDADLAESFAAAQKAVALDADDSRTHTALAMAHLFQRHFDAARHHFEAASRLNPNDTRVLVYFSRHAVFDGDTDRAIELCRQARALNPYGKYNWYLAIAYFVARRYSETIDLLEAMADPPAAVLALLAAAHAMAGDTAAARNAGARFREAARSLPLLSSLRGPAAWQAYVSARWPFRDPDDFAHLAGALRKAGLPL